MEGTLEGDLTIVRGFGSFGSFGSFGFGSFGFGSFAGSDRSHDPNANDPNVPNDPNDPNDLIHHLNVRPTVARQKSKSPKSMSNSLSGSGSVSAR